MQYIIVKGTTNMITSQMLKGVLEGCILNIIGKQKVYGYEISQKLSAYGFGNISEGTIYPILLRLEKSEFVLVSYMESSSGPKRKYFELSDAGKTNLREFKSNWKELSTAVGILMGGEEDE